MNPLVSISLVVKNGEGYIRECLAAVFNQTYPHIEVVVWDNNSSDKTAEIVEKEFPQARLIRNEKNYGFEGGQDANFKNLNGEYVMFLCVDVILDKNFVRIGVQEMEQDSRIAALQAKIFQYNRKVLRDLNYVLEKTNRIDTTGFQIFRSRRITNRGHGEEDTGQFDTREEIFSYEGACGFFRKTALEDARINGFIFDEDFWWYASDLDLGWRLRLFGWKSVYVPSVIAWHERQTTRRLSKGFIDFIRLRREVPSFKRALDYRNTRLTIVKNDFPRNILKDLWPFLKREILLATYVNCFEPRTFFSWISFWKLLPKMVKKRKIIMARRKVSAEEIAHWFI